MKKYNAKWAMRELITFNQGWTHYERTQRPLANMNPFPGNAPTRVFLSAYSENKVFFSYVGKPSRKMWEKLFTIRNPSRGNPLNVFRVVVEFDKSGFISVLNDHGDAGQVGSNISAVWTKYHPDIFTSTNMTWIQYPYVVKNGVYQVAYRS